MLIFILRYWYSILACILTAGLMLLLEARLAFVPTLIAFLVYMVLLGGMYWLTYRGYRHRFIIGVTLATGIVGGFGLFSLIEQEMLRYALVVVGSLLIGATLYIPQRFRAELAHEYKPWRRMYVALITAVLFAFVSTLYGFDIFFQMPAFFWYAFLGALVTSLLSLGIFRLYYPSVTKQMLVWTGIIGLVGFELLWVFSYVSLGYLVIALLYTWIWYTCMVLVRFHLSHKGIVWKKQHRFLLLSLLGLICFIFLARWV